MAIMLLVGEAWIRRTKRSPEWWDSWVIMLWVSLLYARCTLGMLTDFVRESVRVTAAVRGDFLISASEYLYRASWARLVGQGYAAYVRGYICISNRGAYVSLKRYGCSL